jgi:phytoene synthase
MVPAALNKIFKSGSTTYSTSSLFFPKHIRDNITILYAFVRTLDNFVDKTPQDIKGFNDFKKAYYETRSGFAVSNQIVNLFRSLEVTHIFDTLWTDNFIKSMQMDLTKKRYTTIEELEQYMYGSANVIGLYIAKLMNLPDSSYQYAEMLGKSMQFLNFIRDIKEDLSLGRIYFPQNDLKQFNLKTLEFNEVVKKKDSFIAFMQYQLDRYFRWQKTAEKGFKYIPRAYLIPIKTASDMYKWTATVIRKDPFVVYRKKVKPTPFRIFITGVGNIITSFSY